MPQLDPKLEPWRELVELVVADLGLLDYTITAINHHFHESHYNSDTGIANIDMAAIGRRGLEVDEVLAHELRHAWQYQTGAIKQGPRFSNYLIWYGEPLNGVAWSAAEYAAFPWEIDANAYGAKWAGWTLSRERDLA